MMNILFILQSAAAFILSLSTPKGDCVPDFSRVGYHWGDDPLPKVKTVMTIAPPKDNATAIIQKAVDEMEGPGAILLKAGTWRISRTIRINRSGIVLRGEGQDKTILLGTAPTQYDLVTVGAVNKMRLDGNKATIITEDYVPCGRLYVKVEDASGFKAGDRVVLFRPGTQEWIHAIRMDRMMQHRTDVGIVTRQWQPGEFDLRWERLVTKVEDDRIWFDNPVVMPIEKRFGGGKVIGCDMERISECGIEDIGFDCIFNPGAKDPQGRMIDENHAWSAISFNSVEHSWVRNVSAIHFGYGLVHLKAGSKNITVSGCTNSEPISKIRGQRRYGYCLNRCELCLVEDCSSDKDRHGPVTQARTCGPNVFTDFTMTGALSDAGPHNRLAQGSLYDNVRTDGDLIVQDRDGGGYGHGWSGCEIWFWNCDAGRLVCQNVWDVHRNWCIGCTGEQWCGYFGRGAHDFYGEGRYIGGVKDFEERPDGVWVSHGKHVKPSSLYKYQIEQRRKAGIRIVR